VRPGGVLAAGLAVGSVAFTLVAVVGLYRLPDLYARAHATSKADTLGALLGLGAAGVALGGEGGVKLALLAVFLLATAPTAAHAVVRAAHDQGIEPWTRGDGRGRDPDAEPGTGPERESDGGADG
jgi:multicomponent Na+:H+ antiporter subunit G